MRSRAINYWLAIILAVTASSCGVAHRSGSTGQSAPPVQGELPAAPPDYFAHHVELPGAPNLGQVTDNLFRGAQPTPQGFENLQKMGIQIVVNFRPDNARAEQKIVTGLGLQYVSIPWNCNGPRNDLVAQFLELIHSNPDKKLFIHCEYGIDRTGLMAAAYRMAEQDWTSRRALSEMESYGFNFAHRSYCYRLRAYEANFPRELHDDPRLQALRPPPAPAVPAPKP
jgi:protein tyrosine phosphatase (PTP) superfamily phosphohydrolase (DUF442 family)